MKIRAPAKINLGLRVVGKRRDGYHLLDTILLPIALYDDIEIKKIPPRASAQHASLTVTCNQPSVPAGEENLAYKAAQEIINRCGIEESFHIHIEKRIPVGAGLGGGSTDAAATLVGINKLMKLALSERELEKMGAKLGADVPFFISAKPARARGIGDRLTPLEAFPRLWLVVLYPNFALSTAWVYRNFTFKLTKPLPNTNVAMESSNGIKKLLVNDLEAAAIARFPKIESLKRELIQAGALGSLMSGSGSSVFGIFTSRQKAIEVFDQLQRGSEFETFLIRTLS